MYSFGVEKNIFTDDEVIFQQESYTQHLGMIEALELLIDFIKTYPMCYFDTPEAGRLVQVTTEDELFCAYIEEE